MPPRVRSRDGGKESERLHRGGCDAARRGGGDDHDDYEASLLLFIY